MRNTDKGRGAPHGTTGGAKARSPLTRLAAVVMAIAAVACSLAIVSRMSPDANAGTVTMAEGHSTDINAMRHIGKASDNRDTFCSQLGIAGSWDGSRTTIDLLGYQDSYYHSDSGQTIRINYTQDLITRLALMQKYYLEGYGAAADKTADERYGCVQAGIWRMTGGFTLSDFPNSSWGENWAATQAATGNWVGHGLIYVANGQQSSISLWLTEAPKKGSLHVKKSGSGTSGTVNDGHAVSASVEGAVYGVWSNQSCSGNPIGRMTIGSNGTSNTISDLDAGTYYVKEISGPTSGKYLIDTTAHAVTVKADQNTEATVTDTLLTAYVKAQKKNKATGQAVTTGGFKFALFQSNSAGNGKGPQLEEVTLSAGQGEAQFSKKLQAGTYYIQETYAPAPFTKNDSLIKIEVKLNSSGNGAAFTHTGDDGYSASGNTATVARANDQVGYIKVIKTNTETGEIVTEAGFKFDLYESDGTTKLASGTTDETGTVIFDRAVAAPGTYVVKEVSVPKPWNVTTREFTVTLAASGNNGDLQGGHAEEGLTTAKNVIDNPVEDAPQYGNVTLDIKKDAADNQPQDGAQFKVILLDDKVEYTKQGGEVRTPACGYPAAKTTALTKGSSAWDATTKVVTVTNPVVFATDENGGTTDTLTTENGKRISGWLPIDRSGESHYALVEVKASNGHLINGDPIPFTLSYDSAKTDAGTVSAKVAQEETPNHFTFYKEDEDGNPIKDATLGLWKRSDDISVTPQAGRDAYAIRTPDDTIRPHAYYKIDGGDIDGTGIAEGYVVHLVHKDKPEIVLDVDSTTVEHAPLGTYNVTLKRKSDGKVLDYTGPSTIETKDGSSTKIKVSASGITGNNILEASVGEIQDREAVLTWDSSQNAWIATDLRKNSEYQIEIDGHVVKVLKTSEEGGKVWYARYSDTDATYFANHYLDQGGLPKSDSQILTQATLSKKNYVYVLKSDEQGRVDNERIPFGEYTAVELKPAVDVLGHKAWLVSDSARHLKVDSTTGYLVDADDESDTPSESKSFTFIDEKTKTRISKREMAEGPEIPGATLVLTTAENDEVDRWVSGNEPHYIENLEPGEYTLTEFLTPKDYDKAESINFTLLPTGEIQHHIMLDKPISIDAEIDKRQEIARPLDERYEAKSEENNAAQQTNENGLYSYSLDFKSNSNTWTDEFTVEDPLEPASADLAHLVSITTPQAFQDYDGKMNVWYKTNKTPADYHETRGGEMPAKETDGDKAEEGDTAQQGTQAQAGSDENPTLSAASGGATVEISDEDSSVLSQCSFSVNDKVVGSVQPKVGEYEVHFATGNGVRTASAPGLKGIESVSGWSYASSTENVSDGATSCVTTLTVTHGDKTYTYKLTYVAEGEGSSEATDKVATASGKGANATITDGHENPWLDDKDAMAADKDGDKRIIDFAGWKLWEEGVSTSVAKKLDVKDLGLADGEYVTGIRFEYGRVEVGFKTRVGEWDRDLRYDLHDDMDEIHGASGETFDDPTGAAAASESRLLTVAKRFTTDASAELEESVANARKEAKEAYDQKLIDIDEYNARIANAELPEGTLPKFAEALTQPAYPGEADSVTKLQKAVEAAKVSVEAAFGLGNEPLTRVALLEAAQTVAASDTEGYVSTETTQRLKDAAAAYSVAMDKVPVAEGAHDMDEAARVLKEAVFAVLDEIGMSGLAGRVPYAPAVIQMRLTDKYVDGAVLRNSAKVDAYRNGGNSNSKNEGKLEGHDEDVVEQRAVKKDIRIGTTLAGERGEKVLASDGSKTITLIDTVEYHNLVPGHEYVMSGELHRRRVSKGTVVDGGVVKGSHGEAKFTPTEPDGTVQVKLTFPARDMDIVPTVAYEELYGIIPETGQRSGAALAEHKDINDARQTVNLTGPAADLVQTGVQGAVLGGIALVSSLCAMWAIARARKAA